MQMDERNTYPCRGCGKPHLEATARNIHEASCPQVDQEPEEADQEPEPVEDQDHYQETPPDPVPEQPTQQQPDLDPQPPDRKAVDFGSGSCQCCGSEVGSTTRKGLCYGCDLAGCSTDSGRCLHHQGVA